MHATASFRGTSIHLITYLYCAHVCAYYWTVLVAITGAVCYMMKPAALDILNNFTIIDCHFSVHGSSEIPTTLVCQ